MPEVAEVKKWTDWLMRKASKPSIVITALHFTETGRYKSSNTTPARYEEWREALPMRYPMFEAKGKKILLYSALASEDDTQSPYAILGLGMSGHFSTSPKKHSAYYFEYINEMDEESRYIYFNDTRHFAHIHLFVGRKAYESGCKKYAPARDPLSTSISLEEWTKHIRNPRRKKTMIITFLLDQRSISGLGNYLTAEILFSCRIRPNRTLESLSDEDILKLKEKTDLKVKESAASSGNLVYTKAEALPLGEGFRCYVYLCSEYSIKKKDGSIVTYEVKGTTFYNNRTTYWVPELQK